MSAMVFHGFLIDEADGGNVTAAIPDSFLDKSLPGKGQFPFINGDGLILGLGPSFPNARVERG